MAAAGAESTTAVITVPPKSLMAEDAAARALYVPIAVGNISFWLGKKPTGGEATHRWTVYVRSPDEVDLSYAIKKVVFQLHSTFAVPRREIFAPPFEVTEQGWGVFEILVSVVLWDPATPPLNFVHRLRLFPDPGMQQSVDRPVFEEQYDEIVFNDLPTHPDALKKLLGGPKGSQPPYSHQEHLPHYDATADLCRIKGARQKIAQDIAELQERLSMRREETARMKEDLRTLGLV